MPLPLRGEELTSCLHRIALRRGSPEPVSDEPISSELQRRHDVSASWRAQVVATLTDLYDTLDAGTAEGTIAAMSTGTQLITTPVLRDPHEPRASKVHALWRVGKVAGRYVYAPLVVKTHEVQEPATTRSLRRTTIDALSPVEAITVTGVGPRATSSMTRTGLSLAHAARILRAMGHGDPTSHAAVVDRTGSVWWFELDDPALPRFNASAYDTAYTARRDVLEGHDRWRAGDGPFPTTPYWHRDCEACPYRATCRPQLEAVNDVSLIHYTSKSQQTILHAHDVHTRDDLAGLDPLEALRSGRSGDTTTREGALAKGVERLADLIYRARVDVGGTFLRSVPSERVTCPTADVEVDVDMESYGDRTYLWGASVRVRRPVDGVNPGGYAFVTWEPLTDQHEADVFLQFWRWLRDVRRRTADAGATFAAYCFWAQAEDGAMDRALDRLAEATPLRDEVAAFRAARPAQWIDLHALVKEQIQTDGPYGLKHVAQATGFRWRDPAPSGEASMQWYEVAVSDTPEAAASRVRLLEYNEDDCRATAALRDWLNGPAQSLPHRDDWKKDEPTSVG